MINAFNAVAYPRHVRHCTLECSDISLKFKVSGHEITLYGFYIIWYCLAISYQQEFCFPEYLQDFCSVSQMKIAPIKATAELLCDSDQLSSDSLLNESLFFEWIKWVNEWLNHEDSHLICFWMNSPFEFESIEWMTLTCIIRTFALCCLMTRKFVCELKSVSRCTERQLI